MTESTIFGIPLHQVKQTQEMILTWYRQNRRDLPWRHTQDPYAILVSEIMLQQTQVERVIPYYVAWLCQFPDFAALAAAPTAQVLKAWSGLGYNSRAIRLQQLAREVLAQHQGKLPEDKDTLRSLPGIGPYTAAAVQAFAFNKPAPVLDTNVRRVLLYLFHLPEATDKKDLEAICLRTIPEGRSRDWFNALMDYGSVILTAKKTGIPPLSRQGRFAGSTRQARGRIVKTLLAHPSLSLKELQCRIDHPALEQALHKLVQEGIVVRKKGQYSLA